MCARSDAYSGVAQRNLAPGAFLATVVAGSTRWNVCQWCTRGAPALFCLEKVRLFRPDQPEMPERRFCASVFPRPRARVACAFPVAQGRFLAVASIMETPVLPQRFTFLYWVLSPEGN